MKTLRFIGIMLAGSMLFLSCNKPTEQVIDLSGEWNVTLENQDAPSSGTINLPGTLCDGGYGTPCNLKPEMEREIFLNLKRKYDYVGTAWYTREVTIPENWKNKSITLNLERVIWDSQVFIDEKKIDQDNESLIAPHRFDLSQALTPGKHKLTIRIDNRKKYEITTRNLAHAYTNETQTMWNGVLGEMTLTAEDPVRIDHVQLTPDVDKSLVQVQVEITDASEKSSNGKLSFYLKDPSGKKLEKIEKEYTGQAIRFDYPIREAKLWDEFNPNIYTAVAELKAGESASSRTETFGMRKITNKNALLQVNGERVFMRGTLECCIFPLTGYPPTSVEEWKKVYTAAKDYGLNHIRFHSWCPPKAAFEAADQLGVYLQVELPLWELNIGEYENVTRFLYEEADHIIKEYGNHPSFCFWSLGNELQGDFAVLDDLLMSLKAKDPRHLYMTTTFTFQKGHGSWPEPHDDFWVTQWTKDGWVRGQGVFDDHPTNFNRDYSAAINDLPVPIITHEIGQYSVFPNLKEIDKYTGNLIPLNFMAVKNDLDKKGRLHKAEDYFMASGKLAAILYKEEIERALKTPGFSGFQLLDLHDFPGQGTALVGLLDAFWDDKGIISAEEFRRFNAPVVPLVRFAKATYTQNETFNAEIEVANFSGKTLQNSILEWQLLNSRGEIISSGDKTINAIPVGNNPKLENISVPLSGINQAERLTLELSIKDSKYSNNWHIWVYPSELTIDPQDVLYTRSFQEAKSALNNGKTVLLNPAIEDVKGLDGKFVQVFWSPVHFPNQPGTMGVLCDPSHAALKSFPTEMHSNWQWWDICKNARTMELDSIGVAEPVITMVDNFYKNRNLGLVFEAKVGNGKLLMCSSDLGTELDKRPVARQLKYSLINYMKSNDFNPDTSVDFNVIEKYLKNTDKTEKKKVSIYD